MTPSISLITSYSLLPAILMLIGGGIASLYRPGGSITSATQHFAAGVVFAAVAKELLPKIGAYHDPLALIIGFSVGILAMLFLKWLANRLEDLEQEKTGLSWGLLTAVGIDLLIDGILIGVAFLAGERGGILIAIALAIEIFFGIIDDRHFRGKTSERANSSVNQCHFGHIDPCGSCSGRQFINSFTTIDYQWNFIIWCCGITLSGH